MTTKYVLLAGLCLLLYGFGNAQSYSTAFIDINPGPTSSLVDELTVDRFENYIYMEAESDAATGRELHRKLHTQTTVSLYRDNRPGTANGNPNNLTLFRNVNQIYYEATNASGDEVVYSHNNPNAEQTQDQISQFTSCGNRMYYIGRDVSTVGREIWFCTTTTGSAQAVDLSPGAASTTVWALENLDDNSIIALVRPDGASNERLIAVNGTSTTVLIEEGVGGVTSIPTGFSNFVQGGDKVYFVASQGQGNELWVTDGTVAGTYQVEDHYTGTSSGFPGSMTWNEDNNTLYFAATGSDGDREPCRLVDGSNNIQRMANLNGTSSSSPAEFLVAGQFTYFVARTSTGSRYYLYRANAAGTVSLVSDLNDDVFYPTLGSFQAGAFDGDDNVYFEIIRNTGGGHELWAYNETTNTTQKIRNVGDIDEMVAFRGRLYYTDTYAPDNIGKELYVAYECDITFSTSITDATCATTSDGAISMTELDEYGFCTYDWDYDGTGDFDDPEDPTGLAPGNYTVIGVDAAGCQSAPTTFTIGVAPDVVNPVFDTPTLSDVTAECSATPTAPTATDFCDGAITGVPDVTFPITTQGTTTITWTFTDLSGNDTIQTQNVILTDVTTPTLDVATLPTLTAECSITPTAPTATDICEGTLTGTPDVTFPITAQGTTTITWTFTDAAGNSVIQLQDVILDDITDPVADNAFLNTIVAECQVNAPTPPTATDACVGSIAGTPNVTFPVTAQGNTTITWTFDDGNGNVITQDQVVSIDDVTPPVATPIADASDDCSITLIAPVLNDACVGAVTGITSDPISYSAQGNYTVQWTFDDGNGNVTVENQNVIIADATAPIPDIATLASVNSECAVTIGDVTAPSATDACTGAITATTPTTFPITGQGPHTIEWNYDDGYGNITTQFQTVIIDDITSPTPDIAQLGDITDECQITSLIPPTATDNCASSITVSHNASLPINTQGTTAVTWTYDDGNGNTSTQTQNVIIDDQTLPVLDAVSLPDLLNECQINLPTLPTATDNCVGSINGTPNVTFPVTAQGITVISWTFTDANGNSVTQNQNVIITDVTPPVADLATLPVSTDECSVTLMAPTATDNCNGSITGTTATSFPITTQGTTTVTWTYDDGNGNTSTQDQIVTIDDITLPDAIVLADLTDECSLTPVVPSTTDNCSGTITGTTTTSFPITSQGTTVVTWTFDDGNGNILTLDQNVIINDVTVPVLSNCPSDTIISANNSGCTATYSWAEPTGLDACVGAITPTASHLPGAAFDLGSTTVVYTFDDGNGNIDSCTFNVQVITDVSHTDSVTNITCNSADNGVIDITSTGGSGAYTYDWNNGQFTDGNISSLTPGNYFLTITDDFGCTDTATYTITEPAALNLILDASGDPTACGSDDGFATIISSGGTVNSDYTYSWYDGFGYTSSDQNPTDMPAGIIYLEMTDDNGCILLDTLTLEDPNAPDLSLNAASLLDLACFGGNNGSIDIDVTLNGGATTATFDWDNDGTGDNDDTEDLSNLSAGSYSVIATDENDCSATLSLTVTEPTELQLSTVVTDETIAGNGEIDLTVSGGTPSYTYDWDNDGTGDNDDLEDQTTLTEGTWTVIVTDQNGCTTSTSATVSSVVFVEDLSLEAEILVYPNPNTGIFTVKYEGWKDHEQIEMFDATGRLVYQSGIQQGATQINVAHLPPGTYTITTNESGTRPLRVVIK